MSVTPIKQKPSELRLALRALLLPLYIAVGFSSSFIGALHAPAPHGVKVAIVGRSADVTPLARGLSASSKGAFKISQLSRVASARRLVAGRKLAGAYVPRSAPNPTIVVASAASAQLATFLEGAFRPVASTQGHVLAVDDVKPLPASNPSGTANFFFIVICTLAGFATVVALGAASPTLPEHVRLGLFAAAIVAAPTVAYLIGGTGFGAFDGSVGTIIAMIGMGALYAMTVALITRGLQLAVGGRGVLLASLMLVFLNFPSSGGTVPGELLPGFWRFLHHFWIGASALDANRSILYFDGVGVLTDALKILAWLAVWAVILATPILATKTRRQNSPDLPAQAHEQAA